ncbi:MAG TPA: fibronectin type III domain-containing protein [Deltaproteobacteria bacterium]|jgi:hypothetical protein|nr:fibronectin type III domain-containing protein [Deltaproteobacteria bacterium]HQI00552.1 fibronectin type III domain-containing protein [Deltaproteobacteria bacterium]HQJ08371.1 fibronectin type III domain-containing protein [Deltaproteobacteria bacterium]
MRSSTGARLIILVLYLLCIPGILCAAKVQISWNPNTESDLAGYRVYYGTTSGNYNYVLRLGKVNSVQIDGFFEGYTYYICITAYDTSGNESGFSREVYVDIPEAQVGILDRIMQWIDTLFGGSQSGSSQLAQYSTSDFSAMNRQEIAAALKVVQGSPESSYEPVYAAETMPDYEIRDVIAQVSEPVDLSILYPEGSYFLFALTDDSSVVYDNNFYSWTPGAYLFMVYDASGELVHVLRISVLDVLTSSGEYIGGTEMYIEDLELDVSLSLSCGAFDEDFPIGIGLGLSDQSGSGSQMLVNTEVFEFAVAPYGFILSEPAEIRVAFNGSTASVEYYDEGDQMWKSIPDARVEDGMVVFPTQVLGRFKVYGSQEIAPEGNDGGDDSGGSEGGCFVSSCTD